MEVSTRDQVPAVTRPRRGEVKRSPRANFPTTRGSVVERAKQTGERAALSALCEAYWYPVYCFLRSQGCSRVDVADVTQGFFASLLAKGAEQGSTQLAKYEPERWCFRSWLRTRAKWYFLNYVDHRKVESGHRPHVSIDSEAAEAGFLLESKETLTPDQLFDRCWAQVVVRRARQRLQVLCAEHPDRADIEVLLTHLSGEVDPPSEPSPSVERKRKHDRKERLKRPFRRCLREEIARTLPARAYVDDELELLLHALSE